ncbi:MAG: hypothetical protein V3W37_08115 [Candidatus Binatia bacterium]
MADVNITVNTLVSGLTPAGGDQDDHYFVSNGAILTVDQDFTFEQLSLGINSTSTKSAGTLACRSGAASSFTLTADKPELTDEEAYSIQIWGLGAFTDAAASPTNRDFPIIIKCGSNFPFPVVRVSESGGVWDTEYYLLIRPLPWFEVYRDLTTEPSPDVPIGNRMDVLDFDEDEGGVRFTMQRRRDKRPRFFREGEEGRGVKMQFAFDMENANDVGIWEQLKRLKTNDVLGALVSDRKVWTSMKIIDVGNIKRLASAGSMTRDTASFEGA